MQNEFLWRMVAFSVLLPVRLIDYGLRDYGTAKWEGGDPECEHKGEPMRTKAYINGNTGTGKIGRASCRERV